MVRVVCLYSRNSLNFNLLLASIVHHLALHLNRRGCLLATRWFPHLLLALNTTPMGLSLSCLCLYHVDMLSASTLIHLLTITIHQVIARRSIAFWRVASWGPWSLHSIGLAVLETTSLGNSHLSGVLLSYLILLWVRTGIRLLLSFLKQLIDSALLL